MRSDEFRTLPPPQCVPLTHLRGSIGVLARAIDAALGHLFALAPPRLRPTHIMNDGKAASVFELGAQSWPGSPRVREDLLPGIVAKRQTEPSLSNMVIEDRLVGEHRLDVQVDRLTRLARWQSDFDA